MCLYYVSQCIDFRIPELIEQLKLEELSVNTNAESYKKLKQRIDDVIEKA